MRAWNGRAFAALVMMVGATCLGSFVRAMLALTGHLQDDSKELRTLDGDEK